MQNLDFKSIESQPKKLTIIQILYAKQTMHKATLKLSVLIEVKATMEQAFI